MKNLVLLLVYTSFFTLSCGTSKEVKEFKHPETEIKTKKLNVKFLEKAKSKITKTYELIVRREWVRVPYTENRIAYIYYTKKKINTKDIVDIRRWNQEIYIYTLINPNKEFKEEYKYFTSGNLYTGGRIFTGKQVKNINRSVETPYEFKVGVWHFYDEDGRLIESIDHDAYFDFTFDNVLSFIEKNNLELFIGTHKQVTRRIVGNKGIWTLFFKTMKDGDGNIYNTISLDGNTGDIIDKVHVKIGVYPYMPEE